MPIDRRLSRIDVPSLVMKEMNSLTHSCMHSLASLAILAFSGSAVFMIRATGAKLRILASDARLLCLEPRCGEIDCGKSRDIVRSHWLLRFDHRDRRRGENAGADREHDNETSNRACQWRRSDGNTDCHHHAASEGINASITGA